MKLFTRLFILLLLAASSAAAQEMTSPDHKLKVVLAGSTDGSYSYTVSYEGKTVLEPSALGVRRKDGDFSRNLTFIAAEQPTDVVDEYESLNAKKRKIKYEARRYVFHLENNKKQALDLIFQLSNDGLAFRYYFPGTSTDVKYITEELTSFNFEESAVGWLQPMSDAQTGWEHCHPSYEEGWEKEIKVGTPSPIKAGWVYPALFKTPQDVYVAITEAGLDGTYCGTRLLAESPGGEYRIGFPQEPEVFTGGELNPESKLPWYSPWRVVAVGSLKTVTESTLGMDVAPPAISLENTDWIRPGQASWSWIILKDESINYDTTHLYIDFAADMQWEYCLVDVNWDTRIGYTRIKELADYAAAKNVKLILWYNSAGAWNTTPYHPRNMLLEREGRRKEFQRIKDMGIAGVKIDFFGGDGQSMIRYYIDILEDAADIGLLINFHGATLPRGWQRTYPHLMTAEAIKGQEMVTFGQDFANEQAPHVVTSVFTRNLFDPMDYTPMTLDSIPRIRRATTKTFELASPVMLLSGIQHLAESPYGMARQSEDIKNYLRNLPTHWDETRFIDGYPGKYVVLARRAGNTWYVIGMNGEQKTREVKTDLSFVGKGYIFEDVSPTESLKKEYTSSGSITLPAYGGFVGVFEALPGQETFPLNNVKLTGGVFKNAEDIDLKYILALNPDKLLAPYLIDAGLPVKAERYGNWESSGLDGHIGGHYLSALALMYASTGEKETKSRLDYMVNELARCQAQNGNGYVGGIPQGKVFWERIRKGDIDGSSFGLNNTWVPLYNIHKLFAGLYDAYHFGKNQQALKVLIGLSDWMIDLFSGLNDAQVEQVLKTEHGGLNEAFLDLYGVTANRKYLEAAVRLTQKAFLNPMMAHQDILTGLHANTQIPKIIGVEKISQVTRDAGWESASEYFWDNVANHRSVIFGGNSYREHFHETDRFDKMLETNQGPETCNSYNMLKLSKALFLRTGETKYLDFYEKTMFNHILSSQHPEKGGFVYFTPIRPRHYRVYSQPETSMWCCVGTGLENHARYGELIYTRTGNTVSVNLLVASRLEADGISLVQTTDFPYRNETRFSIKQWGNQGLSIRIPAWMKSPEFSVNGEKIPARITRGYAVFSRKWKAGDELLVRFGMEVTQEFLPNNSQWVAFKYGPVVLATETGKEDLVGLFADDSRMGHETRGKMFPLSSGHVFVAETKDIASRVKKTDGLKFTVDGLTLQPFFALHEARYQMYFQALTPAEYETFKTAVAKEKAFEESIVDQVNLGEQQPEADHAYRGEKSNSGYDNGAFWRNTAGYISYEMNNKGGSKLYIYGLDKMNNLEVEINGKVRPFSVEEGNKVAVDISKETVVRIKIQPREAGKRTPRLTRIVIVHD